MSTAKAVVAALIAGLGALGTAMQDGSVDAWEWTSVAAVTLVALGAVWKVSNAPKSPSSVE